MYRALFSLLWLVSLLASLSLSEARSQSAAFRDDFSSPTLDSTWTVKPGASTTSYSLATNSGFLRYTITGDTSFAQLPPLAISREFSGKEWTFETKIRYTLPAGLGRQLFIHVLFGDLPARGINEALWWHDRDDGGGALRLRVVGQFIDGGITGGVPSDGFGGDGTLGYALAAAAEDTYFVRIIREGQELTMLESRDGETYTQILQRTFTSELGSLQTILIDGRSYYSTGYAEVDYVSVKSERTVSDQRDDYHGYQVHAMYVVPADGTDREFDVDGTLERAIGSFQYWLAGQTGGRTMRVDTHAGNLDVTFYRLHRTDATMSSFGLFLRDQLEAELLAAGFDDPRKLYLVVYDGGAGVLTCGGGAFPPTLYGSVAAIYLRGTPPGAPPCDSIAFTKSVESPGYREFSLIHEIMHTLGFVASCAPNYDAASPGHVIDDPTDLMYAGPLLWQPSVLDVNRDDYFDHRNAGCLDLANSAFLNGPFVRADPPPGWPFINLVPLFRPPALANQTVEYRVLTAVEFVNATADPVEIFWVDGNGLRHLSRTLDAWEGYVQPTYSGAYWIASDSAGNWTNIFRARYHFAHAVVGTRSGRARSSLAAATIPKQNAFPTSKAKRTAAASHLAIEIK